MSELQKIIVIGEPNDTRFKWLHELLLDEFATNSVQARTFEEVKMIAHNPPENFVISLVFLTDDLPMSISMPKQAPAINFIKLEEHLPEADFVCIITKDPAPKFDLDHKQPYLVSLPLFPPSDGEKQRVVNQLLTLGRLRAAISISKIEGITYWDRDNRILRRQIRSLSERHELEDGQNHLLRLIRNCFGCGDVEKIEIGPLGQGKSGASVFHLIITRAADVNEYVLKLSDQLWKLESEVTGHLAARKSADSDYKRHVAILREAVFPTVQDPEEGLFIVNSGQWYAIHYDFLGGPVFGKFIDMETVLLADADSLIAKTSGTRPEYILASREAKDVVAHRLKLFEITLDGLCDIWYGKSGLRTRRIETIWNIADAPDREFIPLPPYQLTRRAKGWVQDFLDGKDSAIGPRIFPEWQAHLDLILSLVSDDCTTAFLGRLADKIPFTLSPVHGDLNVNNVLLWLEHPKYPFVIDLPFYQTDGHLLQDFARLEVELKFALMDRQEESAASAFDNTVSQVPLWIALENLLLDDATLEASEFLRPEFPAISWEAEGFSDNVDLTYKAIMLIRKKACEIQQGPLAGMPSPVLFSAEYLPALLYHTVRSIGYPSLSVFKRLLAVHSAGAILKKIL